MYERTLSKAKHYMLLNEMNKKNLPAMYSTAFWCLFVVLLFFFFFFGGGGGGLFGNKI